jgi:hypothetical protein
MLPSQLLGLFLTLQDIDFDFMYALHSFAATVEGQANATKGDMLVLLDDSNSYWWLVRIVRDHTVGKHTIINSVLIGKVIYLQKPSRPLRSG